MEHRDGHVLRHGGPDPAGDELAASGHPGCGRRHPFHDGMGARHRREPVVETVREDDRGRPPRLELRPHQGERERVAEQHHLRARSIDLGAQPADHAGRRPDEAPALADHGEGDRRVEALRSLARRRDDRDPVGGKLPAERVERSLDAADPRGEVVRDDEGPRDVHRRISSQSRIDEGGAATATTQPMERASGSGLRGALRVGRHRGRGRRCPIVAARPGHGGCRGTARPSVPAMSPPHPHRQDPRRFPHRRGGRLLPRSSRHRTSPTGWTRSCDRTCCRRTWR